MVQTEECTHCDELSTTIEAAHEQALRALTEPGAGRFDAVVWLSAHLSAVDHVLRPAVRRHLPHALTGWQTHLRTDRHLQHWLRVWEQLVAGDGHAMRSDAAGVRHEVVRLLTVHAADEHLLVMSLAEAVGADATKALAARYTHALTHGPTRPHPYVARWPRLNSLSYAVQRVRDHALDTLDSRSIPIPLQRSVKRTARRDATIHGHAESPDRS